MTSRLLKVIFARTSWLMRTAFFGALFLPVIWVVSVGISLVPHADSLEDFVLSFAPGIAVFSLYGAGFVVLGAFWGLFSMSILSRPWFKVRARGMMRGLLAAIVGLLTGVVAGLPVMSDSASARGVLGLLMYVATSVLVGMASTPFIAWAAAWDGDAKETTAHPPANSVLQPPAPREGRR